MTFCFKIKSQRCQYKKNILNQSQNNFGLKKAYFSGSWRNIGWIFFSQNIDLYEKKLFPKKISLLTWLQAEINGLFRLGKSPAF